LTTLISTSLFLEIHNQKCFVNVKVFAIFKIGQVFLFVQFFSLFPFSEPKAETENLVEKDILTRMLVAAYGG
jgi:CRISPR/Cas system CMR-associated protein Cmr1 (group 7 of RAMP superfamily)